jgi:hypothetical protein
VYVDYLFVTQQKPLLSLNINSTDNGGEILFKGPYSNSPNYDSVIRDTGTNTNTDGHGNLYMKSGYISLDAEKATNINYLKSKYFIDDIGHEDNVNNLSHNIPQTLMGDANEKILITYQDLLSFTLGKIQIQSSSQIVISAPNIVMDGNVTFNGGFGNSNVYNITEFMNQVWGR